MTQQKLDDLFSQTPSNKRSHRNQNRDEFDDLFETNSSAKRRRTTQKQSTDVFDFDMPSSSTSGSLKKKRSTIDDSETKTIDDLFNNDTRKKLRRPIKHEESIDLLDMFKTRTNPNLPQTITTLDHFQTPRNSTTQKKIKLFFDDTDLISLREQNDTKDYIHIKPVLITSGQWLSKQAETKSTCETMASADIPDDERNLMHIQYAPLIADEEIVTKRNSLTRKSSKKNVDGKSFQKQLVLSDSTILRKENLQSCYNALLEDINKPRISSSSSNKQSKSTISKSSIDDEEQIDNIDFFDLPTRRKK